MFQGKHGFLDQGTTGLGQFHERKTRGSLDCLIILEERGEGARYETLSRAWHTLQEEYITLGLTLGHDVVGIVYEVLHWDVVEFAPYGQYLFAFGLLSTVMYLSSGKRSVGKSCNMSDSGMFWSLTLSTVKAF